MALQVWLPLTGNLENKGLCNITATNSGATVNSAGKIGSCYSFDKTLLQRINLSGITELVDIVKEHDFSVCAWLKTTENGCWLSITYSYRFWSNMIYVPYNNFTSLGSKVIDGKWHHLCYTHSHTTLKNSCYIDGLEVYSNVGTAAATTTYKNAARIGNDVNNSSAVNSHFNGDINDVRIYDHCLSAKEVHEIAQGLVLHLPLNGQYNTRLPAGYKELEYIEASGASYFGTGVKFNPEVDSCTVVFKGNDTTNNGMILASTGTKPYWWLYYYYNGSSIRVCADNGSGQQNILGASNDTNKHTAVYKSKHLYMDGVDKGSLSNTYTQTATNLSMFSYGGAGYPFKGRIYYVDIQRDGQCVRMFIPAQRNSDSVAGMYDIVTGTFYTSASSTAFAAGPVTVASASVCDCSGYGHHGTINGSLIAAFGSPRYDQTINITCPGYSVSGATYNYIYCPLTLTPTVFTVAFWFKGSSRYSGGVVCTSANTAFTDYTTTLIHDYDASIRCTIGGSNKSLKTSNWTIDGTWHHYAITYDGTNLIMYKDGTSVQTVAATGTLPTINYIALNYSCAGGVKRGVNNAGYSDYRFYTTVLSATDIRELYDTAASIDNLGSMHGYEFVEESPGKQQIFQTGLIKINNYIETDSSNIMIASDGAAFLRILHHNNPASNLFTTANCWCNNSTNLYSGLVLLKNAAWITSLSEFEFIICEKLTSDATESQYRWKQTSNPALTSSVTGYTVISGSPARDCKLRNNGSMAAMHNGSAWWVACGSYTAYQGGIPGVAGVVTTGYLDLYIRIPDAMLKGTLADNVKFYEKSIAGKQILEV